jgi:uncharacterized repeat protein (TIGR01451 family)
MLLGLVLAALARPAAANTCAPATVRGTAPSDYQTYCWLDFTGYSDAQAQAGGQAFSFSLPDGSTLTLTLQVTTNGANPALTAHVVPSWSGSAIGHSGFSGIPGSPVLYESQNGSTVGVVLNNISVTPPAGSGVADTYAIIAADGESTNQSETLSFTTNGAPWAQVAQISNGANYPTVSGVGTNTVTETGIAGTVGAFAFASVNNPTVVSSVLVGGGLQGAMFAVRYASLAVTAEFNGTRANAADQFTYNIKTLGGQTLASNTSTGPGLGPFPPASLATIAAGYPFVVNQVQAAGSVSPAADYAVSLTCTNQATGSSSTVLPTNQAVSTYTFASLQYGDAINCLFTDTANRANLTIAKTGPASVSAGAAVKYTLVVSNSGPLAANGTLVQDPAVANFTATSVACIAASGGAVCPAGAQLTVANLQGAGIAIPTFPNGGSVTLTVSGTAGTANISNVASVSPPAGLLNSNPTPTSTAVTTVTPAADAATTLTFAAGVNAGQPVTGTVLYTNNGPSTAAGLTYSLSVAANLAVAPTLSGLPAGVTYAYVPGTGVITLTGMPATLTSGTSLGPISVSYTQPASGTSVVTSTINSTTTDPNPANNTATVTITGSTIADVSTALNFPASVNAGLPVTGTVLYTNNGPSTAAGVTYTLSVAANLAVAPTLSGLPAGATYAYVPGTGVITLTGMPATLTSGTNVGPISVSYTQPASGTSVVTSTINSTTTDPNPANNTATTTVGGSALADVATKLTFPASVNAGQPVSGTVLYTNNGPSTATGLTYTLIVAANLAAAPTLTGLPAGATYVYVPSTGVITLSGMPTTLTSGTSLGLISVSYTQPGSATSVVTSTINGSITDPNLANNTATATILGSPAADVATTVSFPGSVNAGQPVTGTVLYTNNGPSTASGMTFTLSVAANLAVAPTLSGLPAGVTYVYVPSTGVITLTGMPSTLASGASLGPISVSYTQPGSGTSVVTSTINSTTTDPNPANNTATTTISGSAVADVATTLSFPGSVNAGQPVTGTVLYANSGPSTASGTTFTLSVAANLAVAPTLSGLPAGVTYAYVPGTGVITLTGMPSSLASGASLGPISVSYVQPGSATSVVTSTINSTTTDPNPANNTATVTITGSTIADIATKVNFPVSVNAGQAVTGTVLYTNSGPSTAAGVTYTLSVAANLAVAPTLSGLPAGVTYSYAPGTGVITLTGMPATLASGASLGPISLSYTQPASGTSVVTSTINSTTTDLDPANNTATATISGVAEADAAVKLTFPAHVNAGQPVAGTVLFNNNGPSTAAGVTYTLSVAANLATPPTLGGLPAGATYSYVSSTGVITLTGMPATLASGVSLAPISVNYTQPPSGTSVFAAAVHATTHDPNLSNNAATATITGVPVADVAVKLTFPPHVNAGQTVAGTVLYINNGPSTASGTTFTLSVAPNLPVPPTLTGLPAGVTYVYVPSTGVITLSGTPSTLAAGASLGPIGVSYTQPPSGTSTVHAAIGSTTLNADPAASSASVTITGAAAELVGTVFIDHNQDGIFDAGDSGISGATVELLSGTHVVASTVTNGAGQYTFTGAVPGNYSVSVVAQKGYVGDTPTPVAVTVGGTSAALVNFGEIPAGAVGALVLTKTSPLVNVSAGQSVPYTITARNSQSTAIINSTVSDLMPAGFRYRVGSGAINGKKTDPTVSGRELTWTHLSFAPGETKTFTLVLTVGAGVGGGDYVNQATAYNSLTHGLISNLASATVRMVGDPTFDCPDLIGKVFDDANANGVQDPGEKGIAGVRLVTAQGLLVTTDAQGRYHIACPVMSPSDMGTNFIVKVDERTLPSGYRLTTDNPETVRLTAGKLSKLNFGATIHHVVRIEVNDAAFDGKTLSREVADRLDALVSSLKEQKAIVRLAYEASNESDELVSSRMQILKSAVAALWKAKECRYPLHIEEDIVRATRPADAGGTRTP